MAVHLVLIVEAQNVLLVPQRGAVVGPLNRGESGSLPVSVRHAGDRSVQALDGQLGPDEGRGVDLGQEELDYLLELAFGDGEARDGVAEGKFVLFNGGKRGDHEVKLAGVSGLGNPLLDVF